MLNLSRIVADLRRSGPTLVLVFTFASMALVTAVLIYEAADRRERAIQYGQERVRLSSRIFSAYIRSSLDKYFLLSNHLTDELMTGNGLSDAELRRLAQLDSSIMDILLLTPEGKIRYWSGSGTPPAVADREYYTALAKPGGPTTYISHPTRSRVHLGRWFVGISQAIRGAEGELAGIAVVLLDVAALAQDIRQTLDSEKQAAALLLLDGTTIVRLPGEGHHGEIVQAVAELKGQITENSVLVLSPFDGTRRYVSRQLIAHYGLVASSSLAEDEILAPWRNSLRTSLAIWLGLVSLLGAGGFVIWRLAGNSQKQMFRLHELSRELRTLATTDSLTGIANRRHFEDLARIEIERARRYGNPLSLAVIDVDHFKRVNDRYGHPVGDQALVGLVGLICQSLRDTDVCARLGGEEFALLLPHSDLAGAHQLAERIRHLISTTPIAIAEQQPLQLTISIGVASWQLDEATLTSAMTRADRALYEAKAAGRNRVESRSA